MLSDTLLDAVGAIDDDLRRWEDCYLGDLDAIEAVQRAMFNEALELAASPSAVARFKPDERMSALGFGILKKKLLTIGGKEVVTPAVEPHLTALLHRGDVFHFPLLDVKRGPLSAHENVALNYLLSDTRWKICRGYALGSNGIWVQHSWHWDFTHLLETKAQYSVYFGVELDRIESAKFVRAILSKLMPGGFELLGQ